MNSSRFSRFFAIIIIEVIVLYCIGAVLKFTDSEIGPLTANLLFTITTSVVIISAFIFGGVLLFKLVIKKK